MSYKLIWGTKYVLETNIKKVIAKIFFFKKKICKILGCIFVSPPRESGLWVKAYTQNIFPKKIKLLLQ